MIRHMVRRNPVRCLFRLQLCAAILALLLLAVAPHVNAKNTRRPPGKDVLESIAALAQNALPLESGRFLISGSLGKRGEECRQVHSAPDKCTFIRQNCEDENVGVFNYLELYYCRLGNAPLVALFVMLLWLVMLFTTIGIAASDFFCINLSTIASVLGMSESMAGVTFLAFGNGSPDVFSTFAAMKIDSGSLAVGELIGAASFIVAVVAGSMAIVRPFKVARRPFIRDVSFFVVAILFGVIALADGEIHMWECIVMVMYYVSYVMFVCIWHWWSGRKRRIRLTETHARDHYVPPGEEESRNIEEEEDGGVSSETAGLLSSAPDIRLLEAQDVDDDDQAEEEEEQQAYAELSNNMRVTRPGGHTTSTPHSIRPSLVGALEFRSVLSSLRKTQNLRGRPIHLRRYSDNPNINPRPERFSAPGTLMHNTPMGSFHESEFAFHHHRHQPHTRPSISPNSQQRARAVSVNDVGGHYSQRHFQAQPPANHASLQPIIPEHAATRGTGLTLTVPSHNDFLAIPSNDSSLAPSTAGSSPISPTRREHGSTRYMDSPLIIADDDYFSSDTGAASPVPLQLPPGVSNGPPDGDLLRQRLLGDADSEHTLAVEAGNVKWRVFKYWPYNYLPPPQLLYSKLFPTLQGFWDKSLIEKIMALMAVPSVFLLTITLPVVEDGGNDKDDGKAPSIPPSAAADPPLLIDIDGPPVTGLHASAPGDVNGSAPSGNIASATLVEPTSNPDKGWNRWLAITQCICAPVFVTLVFCGDSPNILKLILLSLLVGSISLLLLLLFTSPTTPPKHAHLACYIGFIVSISWISTIANEVVGVLKAIGVIFNISDAILGLTIFAVGNSLGDLVADITIAKLGFPVMALSACFGGPMLNILLGVGVSGLYINLKRGGGLGYKVEVSSTLVISAATLLVTLVFLLVCVPWNGWRMDKRIGWTMIALWATSTVVNLVVEVTGWGNSWG